MSTRTQKEAEDQGIDIGSSIDQSDVFFINVKLNRIMEIMGDLSIRVRVLEIKNTIITPYYETLKSC